MEWITTIDKDFREIITSSDATPESIIKIAERAIPELERLKGFAVNDECLIDLINESIEHFGFLKELADGTIPETEWDDYAFDGDFKSWMNDYLDEMYNVFDYEIKPGCKLCFLKF